MAKQTLRQKIATRIAAVGISLAALCGGCESQVVYKTPEQIQQEQQEQRDLEEASRVAGGLLFGMAGSGALDSPDRTVQQNLAVRGAAQGMQNYQTNDAIRNSGRVNIYTNNNTNQPENKPAEDQVWIERGMNRLHVTDPEKAEELEKLRQQDPEKFKAELREIFRGGSPERVRYRGGSERGGQRDSSKFGFVNVTADDPTFEVFADGAFVGNSPAKLKLSEGLHTIEVRKEGFKDYKKEIRVTDGSELNLRAVLEKQ